ncbi:MAG: dependent helicase, Lhr family [Nocardioidaceae bacterium]|nr:dependent helicase, Lhr family [Nocardioidaceae bacterium]
MGTVLGRFSPITREWFVGAFPGATPAQLGAWDAISSGDNTLVVAPTGSGKTLAAFLWALDRLARSDESDLDDETPPDPKQRCRVLYVSPLKALAVDVQRNLRAPLVGMQHTARRLGAPVPDIRVGTRTGDTPADERRRLASTPPDVLITTPESLFLVLTSQARMSLRGVRTVIVDEVHAVAGTKRGAHLALSLERLDELLAAPAQRIGLSATVRPPQEVARYLGGAAPTRVVQPPSAKQLDLSVVVPVEDMGELGGTATPAPTAAPAPGDLPAPDADAGDQQSTSIWPHVEERIVDLVEGHQSTIVFANSRRLAERLTARLNEIAAARAATADDVGAAGPADRTGRADGLGVAGPPPTRMPADVMAQSGVSHAAGAVLARAHHGSVSKEQRALIEDDLKSGRLPCVVATSSLELGIDMGAVDLVVQVEAPPSVASGLQRVGRAGHQVGEVSRGVVLPKHRADLLEATVTVERMRAGAIEALTVPANPLDVLAQQLVAMTAVDDVDVDAAFTLVRRAAPFATLPRSAYDATLDLLAGRYPSEEFAELRPRIVWDRVTGRLSGRPGAQRLAVTSGGTIPDRGLFGVFLVGDGPTGRRVGELDEEMVYESRVGDVFALGTSSWRIEDITHDRVLVSPAPGQPGRLPFWKGDTLGRPAELGAALGAFVREVSGADPAAAVARCRTAGLDGWAADNLVGFLAEQRQSTGQVPHDRTLLVERFRDELGDWRIVLHSPFGLTLHAPWALAVNARLRERLGIDGQAMASDDGIVVRVPETDAEPPTADLFVFDPDEIDELVTAEVGGSALFAARFRECAARALLLPRRDPRRRSPLWQQRQRSAQLLEVARRYPSFPIVLETVREVLQDVYDVPALVGLLRDVAARRVRVAQVDTSTPSPFARSLMFGYVAAFLYEGDSPLAERRAAALALDSSLLAELLGRAELRDLLEEQVVADTEAELQRLAEDRRARTLEEAADLLRTIGPLSVDEVRHRCTTGAPVDVWLTELASARRAVEVVVGGGSWWAAVEDTGRLRDALGVPTPRGVPDAFTEPVPDPLGDLVSRYARCHGPFTAAEVAGRWSTGVAVVTDTLRRLAGSGRVVEGEFRPGGRGSEWCDAEVLRRLRRRSLAALRQEVEPVEPAALGRFLPAWQHVGGRLRGIGGVLAVIEQLAGCAVPASALEPLVLASRVMDYQPALLDELTSTGEVLWAGAGSLPGTDGWVSLHLADSAALTLPDLDPGELSGPDASFGDLHRRVLDALAGGGAYFFRQLSDAVASTDDQALHAALWDLVWSGRIGNDTLAPVRTLVSTGGSAHRTRRPAPRSRLHGRRPGAAGRAALPSRTGPATAAGRWSLLPTRDDDPTVRAHATAELLLERHGVVTRGAVTSERVPGGFAGVYRVLGAFEESGRCRRGYFVATLGAAQFATAGAVDRLRAEAGTDLPEAGAALGRGAGEGEDRRAVTLAATDPANPYGAALPWPDRAGAGADVVGAASGHRPGRKAGALVVLVDGELVLYVERGGRTLLTFPATATATDAADDRLAIAVDALALAVRDGSLGRMTVQRADGEQVLGSSLGAALEAAGFSATPRGLRLRG